MLPSCLSVSMLYFRGDFKAWFHSWDSPSWECQIAFECNWGSLGNGKQLSLSYILWSQVCTLNNLEALNVKISLFYSKLSVKNMYLLGNLSYVYSLHLELLLDVYVELFSGIDAGSSTRKAPISDSPCWSTIYFSCKCDFCRKSGCQSSYRPSLSAGHCGCLWHIAL